MRRQGRGAKASAQRRHAQRRAYERFGLGESHVREVESKIRKGESRCVERQSNRVTIHEVEVAGETVHAVYDRNRSQVVTFLWVSTS